MTENLFYSRIQVWCNRKCNSVKIAVLDDYQQVALKLADWSVLPSDTKVLAFNDHLSNLDAVKERLNSFEIVVAMRERTPFPRQLLDSLEPSATRHNRNA